jgi:hypothetical protein
MKATVLDNEVENRLRRTLHARSDDMAPGDGMAWDPTRAHGLTYVDAGAVGSPPRRGRRAPRRALAVAAATLIAGGTAGAVLLVRGPGQETMDVRQGPPEVPVEELPETTPPTYELVTPDPSSYFRYERVGGCAQPATCDGFTVDAKFNDNDMTAIFPDAEQFEAGANRGIYWAPADAVAVLFDGVVVSITGSLTKQEKIALAATVQLTPGTDDVTFTAPPEYVRVQ